MELKRWLEERREQISLRWRSELRLRGDRRGQEGDGIIGHFMDCLTRFLPACLGAERDNAEDIWQQATHLYGSLALRRGLAAGEVVEELQLLRGVILRLVLEKQPGDCRNRGLQLDLLALNELLDLGVVQASVAYVDDLFFSHLQGSGVPEEATPEVVEEMKRQLASFARELGLSTD